jgi:hypothetical protein
MYPEDDFPPLDEFRYRVAAAGRDIAFALDCPERVAEHVLDLQELTAQASELSIVNASVVHCWTGREDEDVPELDDSGNPLMGPAGCHHYVVVGMGGRIFHFETDEYGRTSRAAAMLYPLNAEERRRLPRLQSACRAVRRMDELRHPFRTPEEADSYMAREGVSAQVDPGDDGGHLVACQWGGPVEKINIVSQDASQNRFKQWRAHERAVSRLLEEGASLEFVVGATYPATDQRPDALTVSYAWNDRAGSVYTHTATVPNQH